MTDRHMNEGNSRKNKIENKTIFRRHIVFLLDVYSIVRDTNRLFSKSIGYAKISTIMKPRLWHFRNYSLLRNLTYQHNMVDRKRIFMLQSYYSECVLFETHVNIIPIIFYTYGLKEPSIK